MEGGALAHTNTHRHRQIHTREFTYTRTYQVACKDAVRAGNVTQVAESCLDVDSNCQGGKRISGCCACPVHFCAALRASLVVCYVNVWLRGG